MSKEDKVIVFVFSIVLILASTIGWLGYSLYSVKSDLKVMQLQNDSIVWRSQINDINAIKKWNAQYRIDSLAIVKFEKIAESEKIKQKQIIQRHDATYEKIKNTPDSLQLHINDSLLSECEKFEFTIRIE
jgi:hypothetical protein